MSAARYSPILSEPLLEEQRAADAAVRADKTEIIVLAAACIVSFLAGVMVACGVLLP